MVPELETLSDPVEEERPTVEVSEYEKESFTPDQARHLVSRFNAEGRHRRRNLKDVIGQAWNDRAKGGLPRGIARALAIHNATPRAFNAEVMHGNPCPDEIADAETRQVIMTPHEAIYGTPTPIRLQDIDQALEAFLANRFGSGGIIDINVVFYEFQSMQLRQFDQALGENRQRFIAEIYSKCAPPKDQQQDDADDPFREQRTKALWDGLRRVYFHEVEPEPNEEVMDETRRTPPRVHDDLSLPFCIERGPRDDPDDAPSGLGFTSTDRMPDIDNDLDGFEPPAHEDTESSNGENIGKSSTETMLEEDVNGQQPNGEPMTGEPS